MITRRHINWLITAFFAVIVAIVFQQIFTSMKEQGIASGGPYDNAAAYPAAVAIIIGVLLVVQALVEKLAKPTGSEEAFSISISSLRRPAVMLLLFAIYLGLLSTLGYHLTTTPLIFAIMFLCGSRRVGILVLAALTMSFAFAYIFENYLKVVLPGGVFQLNIPW